MTKNKTKAYQHRCGSRRRLGTIYLLLTASTAAAAAAAATTTSAATTLEGSSAISSTATRTTTSRRKRSYSDLLDRDYNKNHQNHNKKNNNDHQDHSYHFDHHQRSNRKKYGYDDRGQLQTDETKPIRDRVLNPRHKSGIYKFLDKNESLPYTTLGDVWLCLLFALGWTMWLLSSRHSQQPATSMFDTQDSRKVMGNVLQVSLGEDNLGTGKYSLLIIEKRHTQIFCDTVLRSFVIRSPLTTDPTVFERQTHQTFFVVYCHRHGFLFSRDPCIPCRH
jgi:hypothetical protein